MRAAELSEALGGRLIGDGVVEIRGAASLEEATRDELAFVESRKKLDIAAASGAGLLIVPEGTELEGRTLILVDEPRRAFADALRRLYPDASPVQGVSPDARISDAAELAADVSVGVGVVVEAGARIGPGAVLFPNVYVGRDVELGEGCRLYPGVIVQDRCRLGKRVIVHAGTVIGADGFGYVTVDGIHQKVPQVGNVIIEDDVELGANVTVDRATVGSTRIGAGAKIDNLTQVAHNVKIGPGCLIAAQTGVAGSSELGAYVAMGGQVGVGDHIRVGDRVMVAAQSGLAKDVPDGRIIAGSPAFGHRDWLRAVMLFQKLPELERRLKALEQRTHEEDDGPGN